MYKDSNRKLASIRRIDFIKSIPGADAIECAILGGWPVVVKVGEFKVGDLAIFCEIDSFVPHVIAPFLSKGKEPSEYNGVRGERLRSIRLRKQLSQGLVLPMSILADYARGDDGDGNMTWYDPCDSYQEGEDVSDVLGIIKWEPVIPACLAGDARGVFPSSIPKTDQPRVQNLTTEFEGYCDYTFEVSEKLEGTSFTCALIDGDFHVCSRNLSLKLTNDNTYWKVAVESSIESRMRELGLDNMAIQAELVGPGIQANIYKLAKHEFYVFDIFDIKRGVYLLPSERAELCEKLKFKHVPVIGFESLAGKTIEDMLAMADGMSQLNQAPREGLVFKRVDGFEHFKVVSNQYLLGSDL